MRGLLRFFFYLILLALVVCIGAWFWAGRMEGPAIEVRQPGKFIGQTSTLDMTVRTPNAAIQLPIARTATGSHGFCRRSA